MSSGQTANILRMHAIMNSFAGPWRFSRGDGGLQVYDSKVDLCSLQFLQSITPDIINSQWTPYGSVRFLGKMDILTRVAHIRFVQNRINGMRQRLINAAPRHHVAAEKKAHD